MHRETPRRLSYAAGYIELGLLKEAFEEVEAIAIEDRLATPVLEVHLELHFAAKQWDIVAGIGRELTIHSPGNERPWIYRARALKELDRVQEAKLTLLEGFVQCAAPSAVFHYDLARYHCLLGEFEPARDSLNRACRMDEKLKVASRDDPILAQLWK